LLDSYHTERHPIGAQVLDWSRAQVAIMRPEPSARALHAIVRDLMDTRDGATYMAERVWGISLHYPLGGDHPLVGCSVPNFEFENGTRTNELMRHGHGVLLDFDGNGSLETWAGEFGGRIRYASDRVKESLGLSTVLVRPDGVVAWVSVGGPNEQSMKQAMAAWFAQ
jgi:hypothetical protein